jgi:hypothetical protein
MSHYSTLNEYKFDDDVDDIRGAKLFGEGGRELGHIRDVVFDHATGEIRYLVAEYGHDRRVLAPLNHIFRAVTDEDSFSSDLTLEDLDLLPAFDQKLLAHDREWRDYEKLHRSALKQRNKEAQEEYKRHWSDDPVQHMDDDVAHNITPVETETASNVTPIDRERRDDYVPDVWPERLAPVFGQAEQSSEKLHMVPQRSGSHGPAAEYGTAGLGPKWNGFAARIQRDLPDIRGRCKRCDEQDARAA